MHKIFEINAKLPMLTGKVHILFRPTVANSVFGPFPVRRTKKKKNPVEEQNHFKRSCPEIQAG